MIGRMKRLWLAVFIVLAAMFVGIVAKDFAVLAKQPIWADEFVFLKITSNLPDYSSTKEWLNGYEMFSIDLNDEFSDAAYTTRVWGHPPMASIIVYPMTQVVTDFINQIWAYRLVYAMLMLITVGLIADVIRRKFGYAVASLALLPMLLSQYLVAAGIYVYHDAAMCLFLVLTIWLMEVKPKSKWKFVAAMAMVLSKIYAVVFVLPLALLYYSVKKDKADFIRMFACSLSLVPFLVYQWAVTGNALYIFSEHWLISNQWNWETFRVITLPYIWSYFLDWGMYLHFPLVIGGMIAWARGMRQLHYSYIVLYLLILGLAVNGGFMGNKTYPIMFGAMFVVVPLAQRILEKIERKEMELANELA